MKERNRAYCTLDEKFERVIPGVWQVCPQPLEQHFKSPVQSSSVEHSSTHIPAPSGTGHWPGLATETIQSVNVSASKAYHNDSANSNVTTTTVTVLLPLCRSTCVSWHLHLVKNWRILLVQMFTARMPLLMATSAFGLGRRRWGCNSVVYTVSTCIPGTLKYQYIRLNYNPHKRRHSRWILSQE